MAVESGTEGPVKDPALPYLDHLLDPGELAPLLGRLAEGDAGEHPEAELEKVNYRVGRYCAALYRLRIPGSVDGRWFYARHGTADETRRRAERSGASVIHLPERRLLVWPFPADPRLDKLPELLDLEGLRARIEASRAALGIDPDSRIGEIHWQAVKHMPGKRTVLRFELETDDGPLRFFSKSYRDARSRRSHDAIVAVRAALLASGAQLEVPRPLLHLDDLHTSWQIEWPGESLSTLHGTPKLAPALPRVARALAELHATPCALQAAEYVSATGSGALRDADRIGGYWPGVSARARALAGRLLESEPLLASADDFPEATLHGAFRMSQLLGSGERLALVDFDGVARGDPHYDVAEFQASLLYQAFRRGLSIRSQRSHAEHFRAHYETAAKLALDERRLAWFESAFLLEKLYLSLKSVDRGIHVRVEEILALAERSLDRVAQ